MQMIGMLDRRTSAALPFRSSFSAFLSARSLSVFRTFEQFRRINRRQGSSRVCATARYDGLTLDPDYAGVDRRSGSSLRPPANQGKGNTRCGMIGLDLAAGEKSPGFFLPRSSMSTTCAGRRSGHEALAGPA